LHEQDETCPNSSDNEHDESRQQNGLTTTERLATGDWRLEKGSDWRSGSDWRLAIGNSPLAIRYSLPFNHSPLTIRYSLPFYSPFANR
jgi:hypothetical protein